MYFPREDSFFLSNYLKKYLKTKKINKNIKILDMGSGSGIQAESCKKLGFSNIFCSDIDEKTVKYLKTKKFKTIKSDLFSSSKFKNKKFDLIIFNPPYLPEDNKGYDKEKDTTGGKKGYETILKFLKQAKKHLTKNSNILILFSSLSNPEKIKKESKKIGYDFKLVAKKRIFFEQLYIYVFKIRN